MIGRLPYKMRVWVWKRNPRRGVRCDDLACVCATCTTPGCPCSAVAS